MMMRIVDFGQILFVVIAIVWYRSCSTATLWHMLVDRHEISAAWFDSFEIFEVKKRI